MRRVVPKRISFLFFRRKKKKTQAMIISSVPCALSRTRLRYRAHNLFHGDEPGRSGALSRDVRFGAGTCIPHRESFPRTRTPMAILRREGPSPISRPSGSQRRAAEKKNRMSSSPNRSIFLLRKACDMLCIEARRIPLDEQLQDGPGCRCCCYRQQYLLSRRCRRQHGIRDG